VPLRLENDLGVIGGEKKAIGDLLEEGEAGAE
jgi:hypothetical protein